MTATLAPAAPQLRSLPVQIRGVLGLVTEEDAAATFLLTSTDTLATWRSQRKGPAYVKLGKRVFYTVDGLRSWVQAQAAQQSIVLAADVIPAPPRPRRAEYEHGA